MILKRWALNFISMIMGCWFGFFAMHYLGQTMAIPPVAVILIMILSMGVFLSLSHVVGVQLFPPTEAEHIRPEIPRQPWAWLRPRGDALKAGFPINRDQVVIGRDVKADVMLNNESVSRRHAEIVRLAEGYLLRDLNSKNGTYVNGQRVQEYLLQEGDMVAIGDFQLNFEAPRRAQEVVFEDPEHLSVSQLLSPEVLPLDDEDDDEPSFLDLGMGGTAVHRAPPDLSEGGTEVHKSKPPKK